MTVVTRLSRLFRADFHAVLDQMEEPDILLRQAVREMEEELESARLELARLEHDLAHMEKQRAALAEQSEKLDREVSLCFDSGNESLAKTFIRRRLETLALHKSVSVNIEGAHDQLDKRKKIFAEQQLSYESIRQKAELVQREQESKNRHQVRNMPAYPSVMEEDVELEFIRQRERFRAGDPKSGKAG